MANSSHEEVVTVDVHATKDLLHSGFRYLDVRKNEEFNKSHVENAVNVPYMFITPQEAFGGGRFEVVVESWVKDKVRRHCSWWSLIESDLKDMDIEELNQATESNSTNNNDVDSDLDSDEEFVPATPFATPPSTPPPFSLGSPVTDPHTSPPPPLYPSSIGLEIQGDELWGYTSFFQDAMEAFDDVMNTLSNTSTVVIKESPENDTEAKMILKQVKQEPIDKEFQTTKIILKQVKQEPLDEEFHTSKIVPKQVKQEPIDDHV